MPGEPGVTVVTTLVWFFNFHARLRAHRTPGIPCALFIGRTGILRQGSRELRGEIEKPCLDAAGCLTGE
jgi:hypothetical protein